MSTKSTSWTGRVEAQVLELGLGLAILLVGLFGVLFPVLGVTGPFDPVDSRTVGIDGSTRVPDAADGAVTLTGTDRADLVFADPDLMERLQLALPGIAQGLLVVVMLELLLRTARTLRGHDLNDIFVPQNARRLYLVGLTLLVYGLLGPLVTAFTTEQLVSGTPVADRVPFTYTLSEVPVLVGFLVLALGRVFRRGARLRADTEGLV